MGGLVLAALAEAVVVVSILVKIILAVTVVVSEYEARYTDDDEGDENIDEDKIDIDGDMNGVDEDGIMSSEIVDEGSIDTVLTGSV